jgi:hypothetical protein
MSTTVEINRGWQVADPVVEINRVQRNLSTAQSTGLQIPTHLSRPTGESLI